LKAVTLSNFPLIGLTMFHPQRNWKPLTGETTRAWKISFILKGIESYYCRSISLSPYTTFHPQRNWKCNSLAYHRSKPCIRFHPQRNWKFLQRGLKTPP